VEPTTLRRSHRQKLYRSPKTAAELISRYHKGERSFPGTTLSDECIESSLPGIDLRDSTLRILFSDVNLTQACFRGADLAFTHFDEKFAGANFERAELVWADFGSSDLTGSSFRNTDLRHTHFESCVLDDCDFTGAQLDHTNFLDVSLFSLCKSSGLIHEAPSYVDHRTVIRSIRSPHLKDCLLRMGMPAIFVEYMVDCARSLSETSMFHLLQSTFISYGEPDRPFAQRLYEALHANGVRTFFFPEHGIPGKKLHRLMREGVNKFDRVIVICSANSLSRRGVLNEIEETLQREARDGGASYLIPIRLDDYIFRPECGIDPGIAQAIRDRVVADFTNLDADPDKFHVSLQKLIAALRKDD
jgi:hypothetical protein